MLAAGEETTGAVDMVGTAMNTLEPIANLDPAFNEITVNVINAFYGLQDVAGQISNQLDFLTVAWMKSNSGWTFWP